MAALEPSLPAAGPRRRLPFTPENAPREACGQAGPRKYRRRLSGVSISRNHLTWVPSGVGCHQGFLSPSLPLALTGCGGGGRGGGGGGSEQPLHSSKCGRAPRAGAGALGREGLQGQGRGRGAGTRWARTERTPLGISVAWSAGHAGPPREGPSARLHRAEGRPRGTRDNMPRYAAREWESRPHTQQ